MIHNESSLVSLQSLIDLMVLSLLISAWVWNGPQLNHNPLRLTLSVCLFGSPKLTLMEIKADGARNLASLSLWMVLEECLEFSVPLTTNMVPASHCQKPAAAAADAEEKYSVCGEIASAYSCWCIPFFFFFWQSKIQFVGAGGDCNLSWMQYLNGNQQLWCKCTTFGT